MSRIEDQANYYKNLHLRDREIKAVVHIEDAEDRAFWNNQMQYVASGKYYFISHSRSDNGNDSTGCEQCLRFREYLNNKFFICIDSDLRLLRQEEGLSANNYIAQTHTYSWENHYCESHNLQYRFIERIEESDFNFVTFLTEFSKVVYRPLTLLVYYKSPELNTIWNVSKFNKCIPLQPSRAELSNNGFPYIQKVKKLFEEAIASLHIPLNFAVVGLTPENAYLHIQGHQLYKLINHIGTIMCKGKRVAFTSDILEMSKQTSGYDEIDNVQSDLRSIILA